MTNDRSQVSGRDRNKTVLLIGRLTQEGVTTKVKTLGYGHKQKLMFSSAGNWESIVELVKRLRKADDLVAVFVHLTESTIFLSCHPEYRDSWLRLLDQLERVRSLVFVFENNLAGDFTFGFYRRYGRWRMPLFEPELSNDEELLRQAQQDWHANPLHNAPPKTPELIAQGEQRIKELFAHGIEVAPYTKRIDLTLRIQQFLEDIEGGVFFRLYVPSDQYQAEQLASFLRLFEHYLREVEGQPFSIDLRKTQHGLIYVFKDKEATLTGEGLTSAISRFEDFINLCENDVHRARAILADTELDPRQTEGIIARYVRDYRRLLLDIRHEYERKALTLRQMFEDEVLEISEGEAAEVLPQARPSNLLLLPHNLGTININVRTTSVHGSEISTSAIDQAIHGDITYNARDSELLSLFEKHAERIEAVQLKSRLDLLKDETSPEEARQTARQKIASFLYKIAPIIGEGVVKGLAGYLHEIIAGT